SPRVAVIRNTSTPSDAYLARVPPTPRDSSSGWASTAISLRVCIVDLTLLNQLLSGESSLESQAERLGRICALTDFGFSALMPFESPPGGASYVALHGPR